MTNKIIDAIAVTLYTKFGKDYEIYKEDIPQGLTEPCFFIKLVESDLVPETIGSQQKGHTFDVHYFPTEGRKNSEMFDVADVLLWLLDELTITGWGKLRGLNKRYSIVDDVLHFMVDYPAHVNLPETASEDLMETLEQTITDKEGAHGG